MTYVIGFNGPPRAGKDTAAIIARNILSKLGYTVVIMKYSDAVKMPVNVMLFNRKLADPEMEAWKDEPLEMYPDVTLRKAYIEFSETYAKPLFGVDVFGRIMAKRIETTLFMVVLISDCGFLAEQEPVIDTVGGSKFSMVQVFRPGATFDGDSRSYIKPERGMNMRLDNAGDMTALNHNVKVKLDNIMRIQKWTIPQ